MEATPTLLCSAVATSRRTAAHARTVQTCADDYAVNACRLVFPTCCPTTIATNCICALVADGDVNKCLARSVKARKHRAAFRHNIRTRFDNRVQSALCWVDCILKTATSISLHSGRRLGRNYGALPFLVMQCPCLASILRPLHVVPNEVDVSKGAKLVGLQVGRWVPTCCSPNPHSGQWQPYVHLSANPPPTYQHCMQDQDSLRLENPASWASPI